MLIKLFVGMQFAQKTCRPATSITFPLIWLFDLP